MKSNQQLVILYRLGKGLFFGGSISFHKQFFLGDRTFKNSIYDYISLHYIFLNQSFPSPFSIFAPFKQPLPPYVYASCIIISWLSCSGQLLCSDPSPPPSLHSYFYTHTNWILFTHPVFHFSCILSAENKCHFLIVLTMDRFFENDFETSNKRSFKGVYFFLLYCELFYHVPSTREIVSYYFVMDTPFMNFLILLELLIFSPSFKSFLLRLNNGWYNSWIWFKDN